MSVSLRRRFLSVVAAVLALASSSIPAQTSSHKRAVTWSGEVSHVSDGDTLWVQPSSGGAPRKLRLHGIDAPEICQAHGPQSRAALQQWAMRREVRVQVLRMDDYGRPIARIWLGQDDLAARMVRQGHAWSYRYRRDPGPYAREEAEARTAVRGLFAAGAPVRPYDFRRGHGSCHG